MPRQWIGLVLVATVLVAPGAVDAAAAPTAPPAGAVRATAARTSVQGWRTTPMRATVGFAVSVPVVVVTGSRPLARRVVLQRRLAGSTAWTTTAASTTSTTGRYSAALAAPTARTWQFRLQVPATRSAAAVTTAVATLTGIAGGATTVRGWVTTVGRTEGRLLLAPVVVRSGASAVRRTVVVQRRSGSAPWRAVSTTPTSSKGVLAARLVAPSAGTWSYRLVVLATVSSAASTTVARSVTHTFPTLARSQLSGLPSPLPAGGLLLARTSRLADGVVTEQASLLEGSGFTLHTPVEPSIVTAVYLSPDGTVLTGRGSLFAVGVATTPALRITMAAEGAAVGSAPASRAPGLLAERLRRVAVDPPAGCTGTSPAPLAGVSAGAVPALGVPITRFSATGAISAKGWAEMVMTDLVNTACAQQAKGYRVVETDPRYLAARKAEIARCRSVYFDQTSCPGDALVSPTMNVGGSVDMGATTTTLDLTVTDSQGRTVARQVVTGASESFSDLAAQAADALAKALCAADVTIDSTSCAPTSAPCPGGLTFGPTMAGTVSGPVGTRLLVNTYGYMGTLDCGTWPTEEWSGGLLSCVRTTEGLSRSTSFRNVQSIFPLVWCPGMAAYETSFIATLVGTTIERRSPLTCPGS